ncbi:23S rRNA pseudouridine(2604) synthase RluF [Motilimonas cestriensis]|uniref:Pseudouridine synthase n=1 Tax=Motilimonas cestriensis TaxID=2742685 RepID=A0ABS8WBS4_9GAMM|nr:23S rRNA pseudouridine(2604) synthase RluF [Motilimonas cestriensis]MCE2595725.1 23S rRNA pseudouridine(2604) synthase RluF [Motilimonas cestriensis]
MSNPASEPKRLNKYISETGYCSRREADKLIEAGKVNVNGSVAGVGVKVTEQDTVLVNGKPVKPKQKAVYLAYYKPEGITCTTERHVHGNVIDAINHPLRIFPIGRLDKPSEGLIFLTSDGDIVNKILRAGNQHEKEYVVTVDKPITDEFLRRMAQGVPILGTITQRCTVKKKSQFIFHITLTQGLNQQIRRMCEYLGYNVTKLKRIRIMNVTLENIRKGEWRELTDSEMQDITNMLAGSSKTEDASTKVSQAQQEKAAKLGTVKIGHKRHFSTRGVDSIKRQDALGSQYSSEQRNGNNQRSNEQKRAQGSTDSKNPYAGFKSKNNKK